MRYKIVKNHLPEAAPVSPEAAVLLLFNGIRNKVCILVKNSDKVLPK